MGLLYIFLEIFGRQRPDRLFEDKIKPPKIIISFYILLAPSIVWLAIEANSIANLQSPLLFLLLFGTIGAALSFIIMYFLWRTDLIEFFTKMFAVTILMPIIFSTISLASFINTSKNENGRLGFNSKKSHHSTLKKSLYLQQ